MIATADVLTRGQCAFAAGCTAVVVFAFATWRLAERRAWLVRVVVALLAGGAGYL